MQIRKRDPLEWYGSGLQDLKFAARAVHHNRGWGCLPLMPWGHQQTKRGELRCDGA
jgi:hypothetical protein